MAVRVDDYPDFRGTPLTKWWGKDAKEHAQAINALEAAVASLTAGGGSELPEPTVVEALSSVGTLDNGVNGGTATTITSGAEVCRMDSPAAKVTLLGCKSTDLVSVNGFNYGPHWKQHADGTTGTAVYTTSSWAIDTWVSNSRYVEFGFYAHYTPRIRVWVDDRRLTDLPLMPSNWGFNGWPNTVKLDLGVGNTTPHRIRLQMWDCALSKIWLEPAGTIWPAANSGPRLFVLGDSVTMGTGYNTGGELGTWLSRWCNLIGIRDVWNGAISGTGPNQTNGVMSNYKTRATEAVNSDADIVVIQGWYNDKANSRTASQIATDIATVISTINPPSSTDPKTVIVLGTPDPAAVNGTDFTNIETSVKTAIANLAAFISPLSGLVVDKSGATILPAGGSWLTTANKTSYLGADNLHPNDAGHKYIAYRMREAYRALIGA